jgi:cytochrome bd ubiquinol oxidase subunit II
VVAVWYAIVTCMLTAWAVLDGFDFGAGIVHFALGKTDEERRSILAAIGPIWDGNEVWLVAGGGIFFFAFPRAYAVALSGMYLALMMVLWLLVLRGIAIELRGQVNHPLWRAGWDAVFACASALMAVVAGVALGTVIRGVPLGPSGWFHLDLFALTDPHGGAINGYTGLVGLLSLALLAAHGTTYLAWKSEGELHARSLAAAKRAWIVALVLFAGTTVATGIVRPSLLGSLAHRPWAWPLPVVTVASAAVVPLSLAKDKELRAFLASCAFLVSVLLATAAVLFPALLPSTVDPAYTLDAYTAASGERGLSLGLMWCIPALVLATAYFVNLFRSMRGKVKAHDYGH